MEIPVAIVTGGARGIGQAIAEALLKEGYEICLVDINAAQGQKTKEEFALKYGKDVTFLQCDVSKESQMEKVFEEVFLKFRRIDVVVNNAGVYREDDIERTIDVNLKGPIYGCKLAFKYMGKDQGRNGGKVVSVASLAGLAPVDISPVYTASKHGVVGLVKAYGLPEVLEETGIIFNVICPSAVRTEMTAASVNHHDFMSPEYIAEGVVKLLKDEVNGGIMVVTKKGGFKYVDQPEEFRPICFGLKNKFKGSD